MAGFVSDRLRDALDRLDHEVDRLYAQIAVRLDDSPAKSPNGSTGPCPASGGESTANALIVSRLDKIIERIELALAE